MAADPVCGGPCFASRPVPARRDQSEIWRRLRCDRAGQSGGGEIEMANYFDRFDPEHEAFGPGDAPTPLNGVLRFSPRGGPDQLDAARGVSDNPSIPTPASASGPNAPASAPEPYREWRPLRRA